LDLCFEVVVFLRLVGDKPAVDMDFVWVVGHRGETGGERLASFSGKDTICLQTPKRECPLRV
jgi:hypothetical protein